MSLRARSLFAAALAVALALAAVYYGTQRNEAEPLGSPPATARDGNPISAPIDQPATEAPLPRLSEDPANDRLEATARETAESSADEQIRLSNDDVPRAAYETGVFVEPAVSIVKRTRRRGEGAPAQP